MIAAPSPSGPGLSVIGPIKAPGLAFNIGTGPFSPGMVLGMGVELPSSGEAPGKHVGISSRQIEGLNKSSMNTPGGGGSRLDPSRARASATSLSHQRI
jgi:hypothetical protein